MSLSLSLLLLLSAVNSEQFT